MDTLAHYYLHFIIPKRDAESEMRKPKEKQKKQKQKKKTFEDRIRKTRTGATFIGFDQSYYHEMGTSSLEQFKSFHTIHKQLSSIVDNVYQFPYPLLHKRMHNKTHTFVYFCSN